MKEKKMYVPNELVMVCKALSDKEQFQLAVRILNKGPINALTVDNEKASLLTKGLLVERWTSDFKEYFYEISPFGKAILNALASAWNPKKTGEE